MRHAVPFIVLCLLAGCGDGDDAAPDGRQSDDGARAAWFTDATAASGVEFIWESGRTGAFHLPEIIGGGVALFDMDGDGDLDLYFVQGGGDVPLPGAADEAVRSGNRLYRNDDGRFADVTDSSGAGDTGYGMGVAVGDYDDDGDLDLYVTNLGPNVLYRNDGAGRFEDVTEQAGVGDDRWGGSAAWVDYDQDGDLDLFALNYIDWVPMDCLNTLGQPGYCSPASFNRPAGDILYRNDGAGRFVDVTAEAGFGAARGNGLGIGCADFDQDGYVDLFVANDGMPDQLWINDGNGGFRDQAMAMGCAIDDDGKPKAGMGVAVADVDFDGDQDLIVCNMRDETDSFYENRGTYFFDRTGRSGLRPVTRRYTRFGMGLIDFDNDGLLDLFQANGDIRWRADNVDGFAQPNMLLRGQEDGRYAQVPLLPDVDPRISRGTAFGDIDGDGLVDMVIVNMDAPARVLLNRTDAAPAVRLRLVEASGRPAHGATVTGRVGERTVSSVLQPAYSYFASNEPVVHVGLGDDAFMDDVRIRWVDGSTTEVGRLEAGEHVIRKD